MRYYQLYISKLVYPSNLLDFVYPNFHFHLTTAYAILRHNGVELGKMDYIGDY